MEFTRLTAVALVEDDEDFRNALNERLSLEGRTDVLEPCWKDGRGFGWTDTSTRAWTPQALAQQLQSVFGGTVRYSAKETPIRKIAYCSGSAASMLELAAAQGSAADIIKIAMVRIYNRFISENLRSTMMLQVHD